MTCVTVSATGCRRKLFSFLLFHAVASLFTFSAGGMFLGAYRLLFFFFFFWPVDFCAILDILASHKHSRLLKPLCALQGVAAGAIVYVVPDVPLQNDWACCEDLVINILCVGTQRNKENCMFNSNSKTFIQGKIARVVFYWVSLW